MENFSKERYHWQNRLAYYLLATIILTYGSVFILMVTDIFLPSYSVLFVLHPIFLTFNLKAFSDGYKLSLKTKNTEYKISDIYHQLLSVAGRYIFIFSMIIRRCFCNYLL